ncbi:hypothetical protein GOBAR_DD25674 [Gossypium barbadense]|nr:hypothetical protein GOBAR_DD25674 [Gossypium barbadense]
MFKSARWRSDRNKIKAVFKLQFHATQVTELSVQTLMISVVPGDGGKPTTKLEKATILDDICRWEKPVYESVKFVREPKTGKINERTYHFILSSGLGKGGLIGEASIDFSAYAEAIKTSTVSLPLKNSNSKAILHVSIQRVQENADQREVEDIEDAIIKSQGRSLKAHLSNGEADESIKNASIEDVPFSKTPHNDEMHENHRGSNGCDTTISSSDSSSGLDTPRELGNGIRNDSIYQDPPYLPSMGNTSSTPKPTSVASTTIYEAWSAGSDHGMSTDDSNSSQDTFPRESSQHGSDNEMEKLKNESDVVSIQILSKSKLEKCVKSTDSHHELNCTIKIVINMAVPSGSSSDDASIVADIVEAEENSTNKMQTLRIPPTHKCQPDAGVNVLKICERQITVFNSVQELKCNILSCMSFFMQFDCSKGVALMEEQFFIMKPDISSRSLNSIQQLIKQQNTFVLLF